ncbi:hypothetical protein [Sediminicoccus sp. KRV36]|uniref:hypothetical protein n=1 Tax=Sediminicoccus sp. KRV36 TaxID=3133721 RepID=UPI00200DC8E9|nr:hypothetical protein [Sediminicoccus rosea]UPY38120.1 hypothetical protein LHU95_05330 [Sediminicoccus rosea]
MTARETSLRWFVIASFGFAAWRVLTAGTYLAFGPPIVSNYWLTEVFFRLSKGFLGGLFWPISFALDGWRDPVGWFFYPW